MVEGNSLVAIERQLMARLHQVYGGRRWILGGEVIQGVAGGVVRAKAFGASDAIAIASRHGVGEIPDSVRFIVSDSAQVGPDASMIERMQDNNRELHNLPDWVIAEVDEWDPEREAKVIVGFTIDAGTIAGRPTFGARKLAWAALENKITIRNLWESAGVITAPDRVVDLSDSTATHEAHQAHQEIASRLGSVWAADNKQGWHGGGFGTHWVASADDVDRHVAELASRHDHVRIQPFLAGIPCSIHGMVLSEATLAFRPCEMIMLLDPEQKQFKYSRAATFWDPPEHARSEMQTAARAIGNTLRDMVDFRGVFTLDGVLTPDGFRPTEVNPRFGAAMPGVLPTADGDVLPMFFTHLAAVEGHLDDFDAELLEQLIVRRLDENPSGGAFINTAHGPASGEEQTVAVTGDWQDDRFVNVRATDDADTAFATANWGTQPDGGLIFATFTTQMRSGPPVAPTVVEIRRFLNDHWQLELTDFVPACTA